MYANTILRERLDSLTKLKENSAEFLGILSLCIVDRQKFQASYIELAKYKNLLSYQFNVDSIEERKKIENLNYLLELIFIEIAFTNIQEIELYCKTNNLYFFSKIDFNSYTFDRFQYLLLSKIKEMSILISDEIRLHLKSEWEKIKDK